MKSDWVWMPHAGHLIIGHMCRFHLNTCVNGYIVSTVGEYWPDEPVRRTLARSRFEFPRLEMKRGVVQMKEVMTAQEFETLMALQGDHFDDAYLQIFGYEEIGLNRTYESMVFKAIAQKDALVLCCPWCAEVGGEGHLDFAGYSHAVLAYDGHLKLCEKWDKEVHSSQYKEE